MSERPRPLNLLTHRWLPVRRRSGVLSWIEPAQIADGIDEDPVVAFAWPRPDFNGAAMEFLIGLLSTTAPPADDGEWFGWWAEPPAPSELAARFGPYAHLFYLDGGVPCFLQDVDPLEGAERKDIGALLVDAPGAQTLRNNADLFVKRGGVPVLGRPAAAMALFALNAFAPSGGAGHRTSLRGGGPMTTLVVAQHERQGDTLWARLWANVETSEQTARRAPGRNEANVFPWVEPTRTSNPKANGRPTTPVDIHPLQVFWGMPRRIRLEFETGRGRVCALTGRGDDVVAVAFRTRNYGTDYSEGFEHPLSPYYRQKSGTSKLPVHPQPGGISYRLWPGLAMPSADGLHEPASVVRGWANRQRRLTGPSRELRLHAFGYDMDNMKARAWIEGEMPLWSFGDQETAEECEAFAGRVAAGTATVGRLLVTAIKSARHERPRDAKGEYGFVTERLYRETEAAFYRVLGDAVVRSVESDDDDPTIDARGRWPGVVGKAALALFDECAPSEGLEGRNMVRHVKARFGLVTALRGRGKAGRSLFESDLAIPAPKARGRQKREEANA